jgi:hypothetical protein
VAFTKATQHRVHPTCGSLRDLQAFFWLRAFFYISSIVHARPHAGNASRWVAEPKSKTKYVFDSQSWFYVWLKNSNPFLAAALFKVKYLVNIFSAGRFSSSRLFRWRRFLRWHNFELVVSSR